MSDAMLSAAVLVRVAELLRELPAADVAALAEGRARLAVLPVDAPLRTSAAPTGAGPTGAAPPSGSRPGATPAADLVRALEALAGMSSRDDGTAYLSAWPVKDLRALATRLELRGVTGLRKPDLVDRIVDRTIGFRLNSSVIRQL